MTNSRCKYGWWVLAGAVAVFVVLACLNIGGSVWFDESYTAYLIRGDFGDIWNLTALDVHPPFYYFCLKAWSLLFGTSGVALRMMSVVFGAVAMILGFLLVKKMFGGKTANYAIILMAVSPLLIRFAEEMRMYTLVLAIILGASLVLLYAIEKKRIGYWILYGALVSLGMWTHYFSVLAWGTQLLYLIWYYKGRILQKNVLVAYAVAVGLFLPWLPIAIHQFRGVEGGFWIGAVTLMTPVDFLSDSLFGVAAMGTNGWMLLLFLAILVLASIFVVEVLQKKDEGAIFVMLMVIMPPLLLIILSLPPLTPLFVTRYVTYSGVILWMLFGIVLREAKVGKKMKLMFGVVLIMTAVIGIKDVVKRSESGEMRALISAIAAEAENGEKIVASTEGIYLDAIFYDTEELPVYGVDELYEYPWGSHEPMKQYRYHIVDKIEDLDVEAGIWIIVDGGSKLPEEYEVVKDVTSGTYSAVWVVKK